VQLGDLPADKGRAFGNLLAKALGGRPLPSGAGWPISRRCASSSRLFPARRLRGLAARVGRCSRGTGNCRGGREGERLPPGGALVEFTPAFLLPIPNVIIFQYNPETLTHAWTQAEARRPAGKVAEARAILWQCGAAREESFNFTIAMDATDEIADGKPGCRAGWPG